MAMYNIHFLPKKWHQYFALVKHS